MPTANPTLQVFRAGRHQAMDGRTLSFSEIDLAATARAYNPALHEAPLVVGHPSVDGPAYGWVSGLSAAGGALEASHRDVDPAFAEIVNARRFSKISASFYAPDAPGNPVPGVYYLKHVGFLGAQPPAVKGLRTPSFAADQTGVVEFAEWDDVTNASLWRGLRDWFIGKFGQAEADQVIPGHQVQSLEQAARDELNASIDQVDESTTPAAPAFAQPNQGTTTVTEAERLAIEAENKRLREQIAAANAREAEARNAATHAENVSFAEGLVTSGRLPVASKGVLIAALDVLSKVETSGVVVQFSENGVSVPLVPAFRDALANLPAAVEFGEVATGARAAGAPASVEFAAPRGAVVSPERAQLHSRVLAYQARNGGSYVEALDAVSAGNA